MFPLAGRSVLVIEDEALIAMLIDDLLRDAGAITLGPVSTVTDALMLLRSIKPNAAVLDMNLFGLSAAPVADALAAGGVPFVIATGYSLGDVLNAHPAVPLLTKPFDPSELIAALVAVINRDREMQPLSASRSQHQADVDQGPNAASPRSGGAATGPNPTW